MSRLESVCCLLVLNSVNSTPQWKRHCGVEVTELSTNKQHTLSLYMRCKPVNSRGFVSSNHHPGMSLVYTCGTGFSPGSQAASCGVKCGDILKVFTCAWRVSWQVFKCAWRVSWPWREIHKMLLFIHNCCCLFTIVVTRQSLLGFPKHELVHTPVSRSHALVSPHAPTLPLVQEIDGVDVLKSKALCASSPDPSSSRGDFYGHLVVLL
jgi:hypothetical protein